MLWKRLRMSTYLKNLLVLGLSCSISACGPRGETRTLDDVLQSSKQRFTNAQGASIPQTQAAILKEIPGRLEQLAGAATPQSAKTAGEVADLLSSLISHAGYTARPALAEIVTQYRMLPTAQASAAPRLLVARTYSLLASELETTHFAVE